MNFLNTKYTHKSSGHSHTDFDTKLSVDGKSTESGNLLGWDGTTGQTGNVLGD